MKALLIVDIQNDFMPGGALGIKGADLIIPKINLLIRSFPLVVACMDDHPINHVSFVTTHKGKHVYDEIIIKGVNQVLWPPHCVHGTFGSELYEALDTSKISSLISKGTDPLIDSYSAFFDNGRKRSTKLALYLHNLGVKELVIVGVAIEYCVLYSVLDALELGFKVEVALDACEGVEVHEGDIEKAVNKMRESGARIALTKDFLGEENF